VASEEDVAVRCNQENITVAEVSANRCHVCHAANNELVFYSIALQIPNRKNCFSVHAETNEAGSLERSFIVAIGAKVCVAYCALFLGGCGLT
jgi:hypothetical protein